MRTLEHGPPHFHARYGEYKISMEIGTSTLRRWSELVDYDVLEARYVSGHTVWLRFRDGTVGEIDLAPEFLHDNVRVTA